MTQVLATFLFFAVFIMLFIALALYLGNTLYSYYKSLKGKKPEDTLLPSHDNDDHP